MWYQCEEPEQIFDMSELVADKSLAKRMLHITPEWLRGSGQFSKQQHFMFFSAVFSFTGSKYFGKVELHLGLFFFQSEVIIKPLMKEGGHSSWSPLN